MNTQSRLAAAVFAAALAVAVVNCGSRSALPAAVRAAA